MMTTDPSEAAPGATADAVAAGASPYYLDHFTQVLEAVGRRYDFLLNDAERAHMARLAAISQPARQLYARLVNRRGPYFRRDRLAYAEIPSLAATLSELEQQGLILACKGESDGEEALSCFTLAEIRSHLPASAGAPHGRRADLLAWLTQWTERQSWFAALLHTHPVIRLPPADPWPFLRFLFFGEMRNNLSDFVVRELGYVVPEAISDEALRPRFSCRQEATDAFEMARLYETFRAIREKQPAVATLEWWRDLRLERESLAAGQPFFDRVVDRLGRRLEREGEIHAAMRLYETSPRAPARERLARLLLKQGAHAEAQALLRTMAGAPTTPQEAYAATELLRRAAGERHLSPARARQRNGRTLHLPHSDLSVEQATLAHYRRHGWSGVHSENWLWNAAFGVLLWDLIYDPSTGAFHSPLQIAPADLYEPRFYQVRRDAFEARLSLLQSGRERREITATILIGKAGIANPFFDWRADLAGLLEVFLDHVPAAALAAVFRRMAQNLKYHGRGFPDLFLWREADYAFVEVKSENDQLSPEQHQWLTFFEESGIVVFLDNLRFSRVKDA